ncbi:hypothetical protein [Pendulispora albinea]|uniref:Uncharacterized protein n=1 Tax=Pendulispora albinea TaxID=2741071 RepID=A0ABZ2LSN0_9BACT
MAHARAGMGALGLLFGAIVLGCAMSDSGSPGNQRWGPTGAADAPPGGGYQIGGNSDGGDKAKLEFGNPLCRATTLSCYPDGSGNRPCEDAGSPLAGDGGGVVSAEVGACRVREKNAPVCTASGAGIDGALCTRANDCASGYECVTETAGDPVGRCRHYCCGGSSACGDATHRSPATRFCDIRQTYGSPSLAVPVCMPLQKCELLQDGQQCGIGESCTIVNDEGAASCVRDGTARVGQSCEDTHCASGLACLGQTGSRTCYQLCRKSSNDGVCGPTEKCKGTAPLFQDPDIGICSKV